MSNYYDPGNGDYLVIDGQIVERDALRVVEKIKDYDPNLEVMCLDPAQAEMSDAPFVIMERKPNGVLVKVLEAWQLDDRIIERLFNADKYRFDALKKIEYMESQKKRAEENRYQELMAETLDKLTHALRNPTSTYTIHNHEGDLVRIHDRQPVTPVSSERTVTHGPSNVGKKSPEIVRG